MPDSGGYICFASQDWWYHSRAFNDVQLMQRVARTRTVLFVNSIGMRMPGFSNSTQPLRRILRKARSTAKYLRRPVADLPGFWVMSPLVLPFYGSPRVRALNARLVRLQVSVAARRLGIVDPVFFVTMPTAWEVIAPMRRRRLILNRQDRYALFPGVDRGYVGGLEAELLRAADRVLYVSRALMEEEAAAAGERGYFLDHGVDLDHFPLVPSGPEPADLAAIPHPRMGFFGALEDHLVDFELLERLAGEIPGANLVLIGAATCPMDRLLALDNVHWLGPRPYEQIPRYGAGFDVALMPWLQNEWIRNCNPIKLKEYLALGLPVVTTEFPEAHHYSEVLRIAGGHDGFVDEVRRVLAGGETLTPAGRRAAVEHASWDHLTERLLELAEEDPTRTGAR